MKRSHYGGVDLLLRGGVVLPMDGRTDAVRGDLRIREGRIVGIEQQSTEPARVLRADGCVVMPGLIQSHVHLCQALFRGMADGLPLLSWLRDRIWPLEAAHDVRSLRASARLGLAEMLRAGTTSILDMGTVRDHDVVFEEMETSGIRGWSGKAMMDRGDGVPKALRESYADSLKESDRLRARWEGAANGRLHYAYAPRFILSCSEKLFRGVAERSQSHDALMHTHAAEHAAERDEVRKVLGKEDVAALEEYGVTGPKTVLAHGVQLRKSEMKRLAERGTRVVHCPSANLKLGSGIASLRALRDAGVEVGIGADGAPCNNRMDPWAELREAALLASVRENDPGAVSAHEVLMLATLGGARVLGADQEIGSIEPGKRADVIVVRTDTERHEPGGDWASRLVYATRGDDVRHVIVDGRAVVREGELLTIDVDAVRAEARQEGVKVAVRAGLT